MLCKRLRHQQTEVQKQIGEGDLGYKCDAAPQVMIHARCDDTGSSQLTSGGSAAVERRLNRRTQMRTAIHSSEKA